MTTEDDFQATLDANADDWQTRLVFADWLEERGDPRAEGYRTLGARRHRPASWHAKPAAVWAWLNAILFDGYKEQQPAGSVLPDDWYKALPRGLYHAAERASRRESEDDAARAFTALPPDRRAGLLAEPPTAPESS